MFTESVITTADQGKFLTNSNHKTSFISALSKYLQSVGITLKQLPADADTLIVTTVVVVAGEYVDLWFWLIL